MANAERLPVIWLSLAACTGCSMTVLNSSSPTIKNLLVDEVIPGKHLYLRFHPNVMASAGELALGEIRRTAQGKDSFILVVEGAVPTAQEGKFGFTGEKDGKPRTQASWMEELAPKALAILAMGTCASYGGIAAGAPNPSGSMGVGQFLRLRGINKPLINIPGCPPHPDWFVGTVASVLLGGLPKEGDLDEFGRPKTFYGKTIHENCPRRAYFEEGKFARSFGEPGCLNELGCKGPVTHADCPIRLWNHGTNWCIGSGGLCIGCVEPAFPDLLSPIYEKLTDDSIPSVIESRKE